MALIVVVDDHGHRLVNPIGLSLNDDEKALVFGEAVVLGDTTAVGDRRLAVDEPELDDAGALAFPEGIANAEDLGRTVRRKRPDFIEARHDLRPVLAADDHAPALGGRQGEREGFAIGEVHPGQESLDVFELFA